MIIFVENLEINELVDFFKINGLIFWGDLFVLIDYRFDWVVYSLKIRVGFYYLVDGGIY